MEVRSGTLTWKSNDSEHFLISLQEFYWRKNYSKMAATACHSFVGSIESLMKELCPRTNTRAVHAALLPLVDRRGTALAHWWRLDERGESSGACTISEFISMQTITSQPQRHVEDMINTCDSVPGVGRFGLSLAYCFKVLFHRLVCFISFPTVSTALFLQCLVDWFTQALAPPSNHWRWSLFSCTIILIIVTNR